MYQDLKQESQALRRVKSFSKIQVMKPIKPRLCILLHVKQSYVLSNYMPGVPHA